MAGQERRKSKPNSTREPLLLATMAGQEGFTCAEIQGEEALSTTRLLGKMLLLFVSPPSGHRSRGRRRSSPNLAQIRRRRSRPSSSLRGEPPNGGIQPQSHQKTT
jgi:hypothetical protein